jgi:hypothetical protein
MPHIYIVTAALLTTALVFGGMLLFAMGFASFLFKVLPMAEARLLIRKAFPPFYLFVVLASIVAAVLWWSIDSTSALLMALIAASTVPARQVLMPAINSATDEGKRKRFVWLHSVSVVLTLVHIAVAGWALVRVIA